MHLQNILTQLGLRNRPGLKHFAIGQFSARQRTSLLHIHADALRPLLTEHDSYVDLWGGQY